MTSFSLVAGTAMVSCRPLPFSYLLIGVTVCAYKTISLSWVMKLCVCRFFERVLRTRFAMRHVW